MTIRTRVPAFVDVLVTLRFFVPDWSRWWNEYKLKPIGTTMSFSMCTRIRYHIHPWNVGFATKRSRKVVWHLPDDFHCSLRNLLHSNPKRVNSSTTQNASRECTQR